MEDTFTKNNCTFCSDDTREFDKAFIKARLNMKNPVKDTKGNFGYYASITSIYDACIEELGKNNISVQHSICFSSDGAEIVCTRMRHSLSGQWVHDTRYNINEKGTNQSRDSGTTYARKGALLCLCGLGGEEFSLIDKEQINVVIEELKKCKDSKEIFNSILQQHKINKIDDLPESELDNVLNYIKAQPRRASDVK